VVSGPASVLIGSILSMASTLFNVTATWPRSLSPWKAA
jgi:hypothetical protein